MFSLARESLCPLGSSFALARLDKRAQLTNLMHGMMRWTCFRGVVGEQLSVHSSNDCFRFLSRSATILPSFSLPIYICLFHIVIREFGNSSFTLSGDNIQVASRSIYYHL